MVLVTVRALRGTDESKECTVENYEWERGDRVQVKLTGHVVELLSDPGTTDAANHLISTAAEPNAMFVRALDVETRQIHMYLVDDLHHVS